MILSANGNSLRGNVHRVPNADGSVHMFRPYMNVARFNHSAERMCMPTVDPGLFMKALEILCALDSDYVAPKPGSLYIRPTMIATQRGLGVRASTDYIFFIIIGPVGSYFAGGVNPLRLRVEEKYVRSAPGGTGYAKTGGNYSASLLPIAQAQQEPPTGLHVLAMHRQDALSLAAGPGGLRLGHVARPGTGSSLYSGWRALQLPLDLGLLGRHHLRLGNTPFRYRAMGE